MPRIRRSEGRGNIRRVNLCAIFAFAALFLSACGGGTASSGGEEAARSESEVATSGSGALPDSAASGEFAMSEDAMSENMPDSAGVESESSDADFDRKIIKSADLGVRAGNVRESATEAQSIADEFGGATLESETSGGGGPGSGGSVSASLVLTVPSPEFEDALEELRGLGEEVTKDAVRGEDVTEEFVDLESRERNLLAAEESLLNLYDDVANVNEALAIERELAGVRGEIETTQGRIEYLENRTSSSRITLDIRPVAAPVEVAAWNPATVAANAWNASLGVLQTLATGAISAVVFGWWIAPFLLVGLVWWRRRSHAANSAS